MWKQLLERIKAWNMKSTKWSNALHNPYGIMVLKKKN